MLNYDIGEFTSIEYQSLGTATMNQHVRVYQSDEVAYVSITMTDPAKNYNHLVKFNDSNSFQSSNIPLPTNRTYFSFMKTKDIITMLQPNNTEIFEGKIRKV